MSRILIIILVLAMILGCASEPAGPGYSRENPVAKGSFVKAEDNTTLGVAYVDRGKGAYDLVKYWSILNAAPSPGNEIITISVCIHWSIQNAAEGTKDKTIKISNGSFKLVGTLGVGYSPRKDVSDHPEEQELFAGGMAFANVNFDVPVGSTGFILMYSSPGHKPVYLSLE